MAVGLGCRLHDLPSSLCAVMGLLPRTFVSLPTQFALEQPAQATHLACFVIQNMLMNLKTLDNTCEDRHVFT